MDGASTSRRAYSGSDSSDDMEPPRLKKRKILKKTVELPDYSDSSSDSTELPCGTRINRKLLPHVSSIIAESEVRRRKSMRRRRRENARNAIVDEDVYDLYDPDDATSSEDNAVIHCTHRIDGCLPPNFLQLIRHSEKLSMASWMLICSIKGGWHYETVKCFLMKTYKIRSIKAKSESKKLGLHKYPNYFQAVVKFQSEAEMDRVFDDLMKQEVQNKFAFHAFAEMPVLFFDSDSDEERPRRESWNYDSSSDMLIFM